MWHQIGDALVDYVRDTAFDQSDNKELVELYNKMIEKLTDRLNPIKYALVTIACSRHFDSKYAMN
jgi:hypothetical protein